METGTGIYLKVHSVFILKRIIQTNTFPPNIQRLLIMPMTITSEEELMIIRRADRRVTIFH